MYPNIEINLNYALINSNTVFEKAKKIIQFCNENNVNVKFIELFPKNNEHYLSLEDLHQELIKNGHNLLSSGNRKNKFDNGNNMIYTTKCLCSRAQDFESPSNFCNKNNDLFIAQDGTIKLCRLLNEEMCILDEIKQKEDEGLAKKLKLSFSKLGENCPYEKNI